MALNSLSSRNFTPTDVELLQSFLYNKIHNKPLPNYMTILEHDMYGTLKNPWEIWEEFEASHSYCERDLYFFTTLKQKSATDSRMIRTIRMGTWEGEDPGKSIYTKDTNKEIGIKKRFHFEKSDTYQDGGWILHEYNLNKSLITNTPANNYVLCRFRKNARKRARTKNVGQGRKRKTIIPQSVATTISGSNDLDRELIIDKQPRNQSNGGYNMTKVVKTEPKYNEDEEGVRNYLSEVESIVLGLEAITKHEEYNLWLEDRIDQRSRSQLDNRKNKTRVAKTSNNTKFEYNKEEDGDHNMIKDDDDIIIMNKEEEEDDEDHIISWSEYLLRQPLMINEGCLIKEEEIQMISNYFFKEILSEYIDIK